MQLSARLYCSAVGAGLPTTPYYQAYLRMLIDVLQLISYSAK